MDRIISRPRPRILRGLSRLSLALAWDLEHGFRYHPIRGYGSVPGWLTPGEAKCLYDLSLSIEKEDAVIVELGSWMGQSSVIFGRGLARNPRTSRGAVYCIDPFASAAGGLDAQMKGEAREAESGGESLEEKFLSNVRRAGVSGRIRVMRGYSHEFAPRWSLPIDLLFIDADHAYEAVRRDFADWAKFVRPGGRIAFHDVEIPSSSARHYAGPGRVVEESILNSSVFVDCRLMDYVFSCRRAREVPSGVGGKADPGDRP